MSARARTDTRERILDASERHILKNGFAGTSIEDIIGEVGITKGAFFYHFKSKADLAQALIERYAAADRRLLEGNLARAETLSSDPFQQLLIFVGLFLEMAEALEEPYPGCLFASYCYESGQFTPEIHEIIAASVLLWRAALLAKLEAASKSHPPRQSVDLASLADMLTVAFEGAFIVSRVLKSPRIFAEQLRHYRAYLELLFGSR